MLENQGREVPPKSTAIRGPALASATRLHRSVQAKTQRVPCDMPDEHFLPEAT
jgi:hypothetical protein